MKFKVALLLVFLFTTIGNNSVLAQTSAPPRKVRNVILLIGDGMGDSEITIARNYQYGAAGRLEMDALPMTGTATTYSLLEENPSLINYVTDSAAGGTAWATGKKTSNGRISTEAATNKAFPTILELAAQLGYRTGNITTAELTDATPAVLASHISARGCQGPADMKNCDKEKKSNGGLGSIAEQLVDHHVDVLMGGGHKRFEGRIDGGPDDGKTVLQSAQGQGYRIVEDALALNELAPGQKVLGLFNPGNMSLEWSGDSAIPFPGSGPQKCQEFQRPVTEPGLAIMALKSIQLLETRKDGPGFFSAN